MAESHSVELLTPPGEIEFLRATGMKGRIPGKSVLHKLGREGMRQIVHCEEPPYIRCSLATALLDIARWHGVREAVVAMDNARHRHLVRWDDVLELLAQQEGFLPHTKKERIAGFLSNAGAESVRESLVRLELYTNNFPVPLVQPHVLDRRGRFVARPDLLFREQSVALEYDGEGKYRGQYEKDPLQAMRDDMNRQHALATVGIHVSRLDSKGFSEPSWMDELRDTLERNRNHPFPADRLRNAMPAWPQRTGPRFRI